MTTPKTPTERHLDIDELDRAIVILSARINAASYELLVLIRRFVDAHPVRLNLLPSAH